MRNELWNKVMLICDYCNVLLKDLKGHKSMSISRKAARVAIFVYLRGLNVPLRIIIKEFGFCYTQWQVEEYMYLIEESKGLKKLINHGN